MEGASRTLHFRRSSSQNICQLQRQPIYVVKPMLFCIFTKLKQPFVLHTIFSTVSFGELWHRTIVDWSWNECNGRVVRIQWSVVPVSCQGESLLDRSLDYGLRDNAVALWPRAAATARANERSAGQSAGLPGGVPTSIALITETIKDAVAICRALQRRQKIV
jgi:hypothetical protein